MLMLQCAELKSLCAFEIDTMEMGYTMSDYSDLDPEIAALLSSSEKSAKKVIAVFYAEYAGIRSEIYSYG